MKLTKYCLEHPKSIAASVVGLLLCAIFITLLLPKSLLPNIDIPIVNIENKWATASPQEIEESIIVHQEEVLESLSGIESVETVITSGSASTEIKLNPRYNKEQLFFEISSRISGLTNLPAGAKPPIVSLDDSGGGNLNNLVASSFVVKSTDEKPILTPENVRSIEAHILTQLRRIKGVSKVYITNLPEQRIQIVFDPQKMQRLNVTLNDVKQSLQSFQNKSSGLVTIDEQSIVVRSNTLSSLESLSNTIILRQNNKLIRLNDIGYVEHIYPKNSVYTYHNGQPTLMIVIERDKFADVMTVQSESMKQLSSINKIMNDNHLNLAIENSLDTSKFITAAFVKIVTSLLLGVIISTLIIWFLLKDLSATYIISISIPLSIGISVIGLYLLGGSINIMSIAGMVLLTGIVVDSAIVVYAKVMESKEPNINYKELVLTSVSRLNKSLLTSTITTISCFLPLMLINEIESKIFFDLSLIMVCGVIGSYLLSITVVPILIVALTQHKTFTGNKFISKTLLNWIIKPSTMKWSLVAALIFTSLYLFFPKPNLDYLPSSNYDQIITVIRTEAKDIDVIEKKYTKKIHSFFETNEHSKKIENYLMFVRSGRIVIISRPNDPEKKHSIKDTLNAELKKAFNENKISSFVRPVFSNFGLSRSLDIDVAISPSISSSQLFTDLENAIDRHYTDLSYSYTPSLNEKKEYQLSYNLDAMAKLNMTRSQLSELIKAMTSGLYIDEYLLDYKNTDVYLKSSDWNKLDYFLSQPILIDGGKKYQLRDLATIHVVKNSDSIKRLNSKRVQTMSINIPSGQSVDQVINRIEELIYPTFLEPRYSKVSYSLRGSGNRLEILFSELGFVFLFVSIFILIILFLALQSLRYSFCVAIIILPSMIGGLIGIDVANLFHFQSLDILTCIGFIILMGLVVNNGILIVDAHATHRAFGHSPQQAIQRALQERVTSIIITTTSSIFGMLPLILSSGESTIAYKGIAYVISFGMAVNLFVSLLVLPSLLLFIDKLQKKETMRTLSAKPTI